MDVCNGIAVSLLGRLPLKSINNACRHFAEAPAPCNSMCDNCLRRHAVEATAASEAAAAVVATLHNVPAADKRLTLMQLVDASRKAQVNLAQPLSVVITKHGACCVTLGPELL